MKILVVDDHIFFRLGVSTLLRSTFKSLSLLEADNGKSALEIIQNEILDLVILDMSMPIMNGFEFLEYLQRRRMKSFKILALTLYDEPVVLYHLIQFGCEGHVSKNVDPENLIDAIKKVLNGELYYPKKFDSDLQKLIQQRKVPTFNISEKEVILVQLLSEGRSSKEIASFMSYTVRTVETKRIRLHKKFHVKTSIELVSKAYKMGILKPNLD